MMNKAITKSTLLKCVRELVKKMPLYILMCLFGVMCAMGHELFIVETVNTLMDYSLFISIIVLLISNYFIVENAIESRIGNRKKLFSEYCARFSSNHNTCKVGEWLLKIAEFDFNGVPINVNPNKLNADKGRPIFVPTFFRRSVGGGLLD